MIIEKNDNNIPDYLDVKFITNALKNGLDSQEIYVKSLNFTMGSSGGENYLSYIYRVKVVYTESESIPKELNLIVKSIPLDGVREIFAEMNIFSKETEMYLNFIPQIQNILDGVRIAPKCYHYASEPIATIVFEDMKASGYDLADRVIGLNEDHCRIVLTKLAQYHAGGLLLLEKKPSIKESQLLKHGLFSSVSFTKDFMRQAFNDYFSRLVEKVATWPGYEKIHSKLERIGIDGIIEKTVEAQRIQSDDISTICHGDMWVNNFLFKYENGNKTSPVDVALIDFQGSMLGSIGLDINYFLGTSLQLDVFHTKKDELIETAYYPAFRDVLENSSYQNIPTLMDVKREIKKKGAYGIMSAIMVLPAISMNKTDSADNSIENFLDEEISKGKKDLACSSERFLETMRAALKDFDEMGIFD